LLVVRVEEIIWLVVAVLEVCLRDFLEQLRVLNCG
jgi:hypothetical protein